MIRYIIEGTDGHWVARVEERPDLGTFARQNPVAAIRALNLAAYWAHQEEKAKVEKERDAAFKSMRRHFRASVGYPIWAPHWLLKRMRRKVVERHFNLVQQVAAEMDAREPRGTWAELAEIVNQRWSVL